MTTEAKPETTTTEEGKPGAETTAASTAPETITTQKTADELAAEQKVIDDKAVADAAAEAAKAKVPDKYDLKLPENSTVDSAVVERTAATARELGLSQDDAQKALEFIASEVASSREAMLASFAPGGAEWTKQDAEFRAASLADPVIGGTPEKLAANVDLAKRVVAKFGDKDTMEFLDSGLGSHPAALKFLVAIGMAMSESQLVTSSGSGGQTEQDKLNKMYPSMAPKP